MMEILRHLLTERDNATYDLGRLLAVIAVLEALGLSIYSVVWLGKPWDLQAYGIGIGALFGALGAYIALKKET